MPQPYEKVHLSRKALFFNNLLGGIAWSLGATIGFSLIIAILTLLLRQFSVIPIVGSFILEISTYISAHK